MRNECKTLIPWPEGRNHSENLGVRRKDNIRMDVSEMGREGVDWMHLPQDKTQWRTAVNTVMKLD
jgi:hypothetical protein